MSIAVVPFQHFAFQSEPYHPRSMSITKKTFTIKKFYFSFDLEMTFTRIDRHFHVTLIFYLALVEYKHIVVKIGVKYHSLHLTLTQ